MVATPRKSQLASAVMGAVCMAVPLATGPGPAWASTDPASLCEAAAERAARATGVPASVLHAIALAETGRSRGGRLRPWPWTVNMEGEGRWFDDRATALAHVARHRDAGARSFDVGCFQINHRWHGAAFASVGEMFDPDVSALYAARFLARLHDETGSWSAAAGAYHSRTEAHARRYRARFDRIHAGLTDRLGDSTPPAPATPRAVASAGTAPLSGRLPLLGDGQGGDAPRLGSLVPLPAAPVARLVALD